MKITIVYTMNGEIHFVLLRENNTQGSSLEEVTLESRKIGTMSPACSQGEQSIKWHRIKGKSKIIDEGLKSKCRVYSTISEEVKVIVVKIYRT